MIKRIRYVYNEVDGSYESVRAIPTNIGSVFVRYRLDNRIVMIVSADDNRVIDNWVSNSNHQIKISVKKRLSEMGVEFEKETRQRKE